MSGDAVTLNLGSSSASLSERDMVAFFRNRDLAHGAVESLNSGFRAMRGQAERAVRSVLSVGKAVSGVVSGLMQVQSVSVGLDKGLMRLYRWSKRFCSSFAASLDLLATDAKYLQNSLAAMAAPLLRAVAPAVDIVANAFARTFNLVNQSIARLSGASSYVAARKVADAWDSVGGRITKASSAMRRFVAAFDDINVLYSGSSDRRDTASEIASMFEERPIEGGLAAFIDAVRAALDSGDWHGLGAVLGDKVDEIVSGIDWKGVGADFGHCLNGAICTAAAFLNRVDFINLGASVAEFLGTALGEVDFSSVGELLAGLLAAPVEGLAGFAARFDWASLAADVAEGFNAFVGALGDRLDGIDWAELASRLTAGLNRLILDTNWAALGQMLSARVNDLFCFVGTAALEFDWREAGRSLASGINSFFAGVDWEAIGRWFDATVKGVLDFAIAFLRGFDAKGFAKGVGRALEKVDWAGIAAKLWELLAAALSKLGELNGAGGLLGRLLGGLFGGGTAGAASGAPTWGSLLGGLNLLGAGGGSGSGVSVGVDFTANGNSGYKNDGLLGYLKQVFAPGTDAQTRVELVKKGWSDLKTFVGTNNALSALVGLVKNGWSALSAFVGTDNPLKALINLARGNYTSLGAFVGSSVSALVNLARGNYTSLGAFVGSSVSAVVNLTKNGSNWAGKTLEQWVGGAVNTVVNLTKQDSNWAGQTLLQWVGGAISVVTNLTKQGSNWAGQTLAQWIGGAVSLIANLTNTGANWNSNGWTLSKFVGGAVSLIANLTQYDSNWHSGGIVQWFRNNAGSPTFAADLAANLSNWYQNGVGAWFGSNAGSPDFAANVTSTGSNWVKDGISKWFAAAAGVVTFVANLVLGTTSSKKKAAGGYISAGGHDYSFATGGAIMRSGRATWWDSVAKYASGTSRAHGTVFVAGEAGPEVLGHVNGRTEILNKSQLAQAIYGAVVSGMGQAVNALGRYLAAHMTTCANGIIAAVGRAPELSMLRALEYHAPALATGGVLPYEVAAQLARGTADLQGTLDANNEDLIQTIISVIGAQTAAIVGALQAQQRQGASAGGLSAQQVINEINRRTMMGLQPLKGV